ncbi:MAG: hypothetical protein DWB42_21290, partial [Chloroflexi bacterium]|nr:hypothetical protein [Chloroflexota bacterium]
LDGGGELLPLPNGRAPDAPLDGGGELLPNGRAPLLPVPPGGEPLSGRLEPTDPGRRDALL